MNKKIRKHIVDAAYHAKHGHMPSALSIVDILTSLDSVVEPEDDIILSKGHGCLAYYGYLVEKGLITIEEMRAFGKAGSKLGGHPDKNKVPGVRTSTGSLGQGLPTAVGIALARKIMNRNGKVYCIIGDGECNEGSIWEALMVAVNHKLYNLVVIVDDNDSQTRSMPSTNMLEKMHSFGLFATTVDGHNLAELGMEFESSDSRPRAIVARTIKGKGINELESNTFAWHHRAPNEHEYIKFTLEIDEN